MSRRGREEQQRRQDLEVIAIHIVRKGIRYSVEDYGWEQLCPDIGERDWDDVVDILDGMYPDYRGARPEFLDAYARRCLAAEGMS